MYDLQAKRLSNTATFYLAKINKNDYSSSEANWHIIARTAGQSEKLCPRGFPAMCWCSAK